MSRYDWESGTVKFSVKEWTQFKRKFREGYNKLQDREKADATRHWEQYKKGKLPVPHSNPTFENEQQRFWKIWNNWVLTNTDPNRPDVGMWQPRSRPRKPTRKDYPLANNQRTEFNFEEASIIFRITTREVHYFSGENNHQVEYARHDPVGQLFFRLLKEVRWTRGTGGRFVGNDEYNQQETGEGQGSNYCTANYGPKSTRGTKSLGKLFRM